MKHILTISLACLLAAGLASCSQEKSVTESNPQAEQTTQEEIKESNKGKDKQAKQGAVPSYAAIRQVNPNKNSGRLLSELTYKTTSMDSIASVSDTVVIGTFQSKESYVENGFINTKGKVKVEQVLYGDCPDTLVASMAGGSIPYKDVGQIYSPKELEKYGIDPENPNYTEYSTTVADMPVFETGQRYLIILVKEDKGEYRIMSSIFNLCTLPEADEAAANLKSANEIEQAAINGKGENEELDGTVFSIEEYLSDFK